MSSSAWANRIWRAAAASGTPTASGNFNVVVAASDGVNTATQSFVWTITDPAPLQVQPPAPPAPMLSGGSATYTANVSNGLNARVRWDFDDGTPVTQYSTNTTINHTFTQPGVYYVTVTALSFTTVASLAVTPLPLIETTVGPGLQPALEPPTENPDPEIVTELVVPTTPLDGDNELRLGAVTFPPS